MTKVSLRIVNDTNSDQEFRIRYADVQDDDSVWVRGNRSPRRPAEQRGPVELQPPLRGRGLAPVVSGDDVPDDLTLDFGIELT